MHSPLRKKPAAAVDLEETQSRVRPILLALAAEIMRRRAAGASDESVNTFRRLVGQIEEKQEELDWLTGILEAMDQRTEPSQCLRDTSQLGRLRIELQAQT